MEIKITHVSVFPLREPQGKLRGFARVVINEAFSLTQMRIYEGQDGLFVGYPLDPNHKGEDYRQIFYPMNRDLRQYFDEVIIAEYKKALQAVNNG